MANKTITGLPDATDLTGASFPGVQGGVTKEFPLALFNTHNDARYQAKDITLDTFAALNDDQVENLTALANLSDTPALVEKTGDGTFADRLLGISASTSVPTRANVDARHAMFVDTVAALRALTTVNFAGPYICTGSYYARSAYVDGYPRGSGVYWLDSSDTTTSDNGSTVLVDASSRRWKLIHDGTIRLSQCGAYCDLPILWTANSTNAVPIGDARYYNNNIYKAATSAVTGATPPTHTSGTVSDGSVDWTFFRAGTDDLAAINRGIALLEDGASGVRCLISDPGDVGLSDTPTPITRAGRSVIGFGLDTSEWRFLNNAGTNGTFLQIGTTANNAQRLKIAGIAFVNDNSASLTGGEAAVWFRRCSQVDFTGCHFSGCNTFMQYGGPADGEAAIRVMVNNCHGGPTGYNGAHLFNVQAAAGCLMTNCFWSGQITGCPNSHIVAMIAAAKSAGDDDKGIDGLQFSNVIWNGNRSDMEYGFVFDATNPGIGNVRFSNCVMDGGKGYSILFRIGSTASSDNARIYNINITGCRISASAAHISQGGGGVHIDHEVGNYIHGVNIIGNVFAIGPERAVYHERTGSGSFNDTGFVFDGNTFSNAFGTVACRVATTAAITIATALNAGDTIDGVTLADGDRVLVKNQAAPAENGVYVVGASPARATDFDEWAEIAGATVYVTAGSANAATGWECTSALGGTLGTTNITWSSITPTRPVFEINGQGFVITNNRVGSESEQVDSATGANFWTDFVRISSTNAWNCVIAGNECSKISSTYPVNVSALGVDNIRNGPKISNNSGKPENPIRHIQLSNTTGNLATQVMTNGTRMRIAGRVSIVQDDDTDWAEYTFDVVATCASSTVTIRAGGTPTEVLDTSGGCSLVIDGSGSDLRIRPTVPAGTWDCYLYLDAVEVS